MTATDQQILIELLELLNEDMGDEPLTYSKLLHLLQGVEKERRIREQAEVEALLISLDEKDKQMAGPHPWDDMEMRIMAQDFT